MNTIDRLIMGMIYSRMGRGWDNGIHYSQLCDRQDAGIMSALSGAEHSANPWHYKAKLRQKCRLAR